MNDDIVQEFDKIWKKIHEMESSMNNNKNSMTGVIDNRDSNNSLYQEIKGFCSINEIDENKIKFLIDFQENLPRLMKIPNEKTRTKLQINSLFLLAPLYSRIYKKQLSEKNVRELFELSKIPLERMDKLYSSNLFTKFFSKSGTDIRLSWAGEQEGVKKLRELSNNIK